MRVYAGIMMVIYPFGLPLVFAYLLFWKYRTDMHELQVLSIASTDMHELTKLSSRNLLKVHLDEGDESALAKQEEEVHKRLPHYMVKLIGDYRGRYYYFEILRLRLKKK